VSNRVSNSVSVIVAREARRLPRELDLRGAEE
jgi:hypothetical protein